MTTTRTHTSTHDTSSRTTSARSTAGAAAGPMFTDAQTSDLGVQLVARGPQDTSVRTGQDAHGRYVTVAVGRTLVYTYDTDTITAHVAGWRHAHTRARRVFPDHYRAPLPHLEAGGVRSVGAAVLHTCGQLRPVVTAGRPPAAAAPFVTVATGRLTTVCLDASAVASALAACLTGAEKDRGRDRRGGMAGARPGQPHPRRHRRVRTRRPLAAPPRTGVDPDPWVATTGMVVHRSQCRRPGLGPAASPWTGISPAPPALEPPDGLPAVPRRTRLAQGHRAHP